MQLDASSVGIWYIRLLLHELVVQPRDEYESKSEQGSKDFYSHSLWDDDDGMNAINLADRVQELGGE